MGGNTTGHGTDRANLKTLKATAQLTNAAAAQVTAVEPWVPVIESIVLHNTHTASIDVHLWRVASGGTAADTNKIMQQSVPADDTVVLGPDDFGMIVLENNGDSLQAMADTGSKVTITVTGTEY